MELRKQKTIPYFVVQENNSKIKTQTYISILLTLLLNVLLFNSIAENSLLYNPDSIAKYSDVGDYASARNYLLSVKDRFDDYSDSVKVHYLLQLGINSAYSQNEDEGFKYLQSALTLAEKNQNEYLISGASIQLIEFYRKVRDYKSALVIIKKLAQTLPKKIELRCSFYHRASAVYNELYGAKNGSIPKYLDTAVSYSLKSLAISKKLKLLNAQFISYRELSGIYNSTSFLHSISKSNLYMDSAQSILKSKDEYEYNNLMKAKAHLFLNKKEYDSAIIYAKRVLPFLIKLNNYQLQMETYWLLKQSYFGKKDSITALKYMVKESQSDVKLREHFSKSQLAELTTAYQVEIKDKLLASNQKALILSSKENRYITYIVILLLIATSIIIIYTYKTKRKNKLLAKLLEENEFLASESNHRIKNNLQLIVSLIGREVYKSNQSQKELLQISEKINAIAALHQQLYISEKKDIISLKSYMDSIEQNLRSGLIQESVKFTMEIEDFEVPIDRAVYVGLLITELIINSLKHAFYPSQLKSIKISAWKADENCIHFNYQDNGKGIDSNKSPSLINLLLKQLKATITVDNSMGYNLNFKFKV